MIHPSTHPFIHPLCHSLQKLWDRSENCPFPWDRSRYNAIELVQPAIDHELTCPYMHLYFIHHMASLICAAMTVMIPITRHSPTKTCHTAAAGGCLLLATAMLTCSQATASQTPASMRPHYHVVTVKRRTSDSMSS